MPIFELGISYAALLLFLMALLCMAIIDIRHRKIYNGEVLVLIGVWLVWKAIEIGRACASGASLESLIGEPNGVTGISVVDGLLAAFVFGVGALILTLIFERITGRFAMGGGDIKLLFAVGLFLGIEGEAVALLMACLLSALIGGIIALGERMRTSAWFSACSDTSGDFAYGEDVRAASSLRATLPFGPFMAIGCVGSLMLLLF